MATCRGKDALNITEAVLNARIWKFALPRCVLPLRAKEVRGRNWQQQFWDYCRFVRVLIRMQIRGCSASKMFCHHVLQTKNTLFQSLGLQSVVELTRNKTWLKNANGCKCFFIAQCGWNDEMEAEELDSSSKVWACITSVAIIV